MTDPDRLRELALKYRTGAWGSSAEWQNATQPTPILALLDRLSAAEQLAEVWKEKAHKWAEQGEESAAEWMHACRQAEKERNAAYERAAQAVLSLTGSFNDAQRSALAAVIRALSPLTALPQTQQHETAQHETTGNED